MTVTVIVPQSLAPAFDGKKSVELGVPARADVGDVLQTLLTLYPKLAVHLPNERRPVRQHLNLLLTDAAGRDIASGKGALREGQVLYLFASTVQPPPLAGRGR